MGESFTAFLVGSLDEIKNLERQDRENAGHQIKEDATQKGRTQGDEQLHGVNIPGKK